MIIKVATSRDSNGKVNWTNLYASAIRNRLRRDLNLADIPDVEAARNNLGITGYIDNATENLSTDLKNYIDRLINELDTALRNHIQIVAIDPIGAHDIRITDLENAMLTEDDIYSFISLFWEANIPGVKQEAKDRSDNYYAELRAYIDASIQALRNSLSTSTGEINGTITGILSRLGLAEGDITALKERVDKLDNPNDGRVTRLDNMTNGRVFLLEQRMTDIDGGTEPTKGRMYTAEQNIIDLQGRVLDLDDKNKDSAGNFKGKVPALEATVDKLKHDLGTLTTDVRNLDDKSKNSKGEYIGKVPALEDTVSTLKTNLGTLTTDVRKLDQKTAPKGRVTELEDSVRDLEDKVNKLDQLPVGTIIAYAGSAIPEKWHICDGSTVNGIELVNLKGKFIMGYGSVGNLKDELPPTLPNITGTVTSDAYFAGDYPKAFAPEQIGGAFYLKHDLSTGKHLKPSDTDGEGAGIQVLGFEASRGATTEGIYQDNATVRPPSVVLYYIQKIKE